MKELTRKQKLDFVLHCMDVVTAQQNAPIEDDAFICWELDDFFVTLREKNRFTEKERISLFPELLMFSRRKNEIQFWSDKHEDAPTGNRTRATILSFIYNML